MNLHTLKVPIDSNWHVYMTPLWQLVQMYCYRPLQESQGFFSDLYMIIQILILPKGYLQVKITLLLYREISISIAMPGKVKRYIYCAHLHMLHV